ARSEAILYASNDLRLPLHVAASRLDAQGNVVKTSLYELQADMTFERLEQPELEKKLREEYAPTADFEVDDASVVVTDREGNRFRLPKGHADFDHPSPAGYRRGIREVVTERSLM